MKFNFVAAAMPKTWLPPKFLLVMKLIMLLTTIAFLQASAKSFSQTVSASEKNAPLEKVFGIIEKQTGYTFYYKIELLKRSKNVDLSLKNAPLEKALQIVFKDQPLTYNIVEKNIVVMAKEPTANVTNEMAPNPLPPGQIKGRVYGENGALSGASVLSKKTHKGTSTDVQGNFTLTGIPDADTLLVNFIGYEENKIPVKQAANGTLFIVLKVTTIALDELRVIAYGTATRRYSVGSMATVSAKEIEEQHVSNPLEALTGKVAGLQVTSTSGAPGAMVLTQIRGQKTLPQYGYLPQTSLRDYNQPLYVIDGVPFAAQNRSLSGNQSSLSAGPSSFYNNTYAGVSPLNSINPLDIESITVLKDADATAIYGSRAANGVILINTKKGKPGRTAVNVSINTGPTTAARNVTMMNTQQYLQMRKEALKNDGRAPSLIKGDYDVLLFDSTKNNDWYKQLLGNTAQHTDVHIGLSGGYNTVSYSLGAGFTKNGFNYPGNFADNRYTLNNNIAIRSANNKLALSLTSMISYDDNQNSSGVSTFGLINLPPNFPDLLDNAGNLVWNYGGYTLSQMSKNRSPNYYAGLRQPHRDQSYALNESLHFSYSLLKGLNLEANIGYSRVQADGYSATPISSQAPASYSVYGNANFQTRTNQLFDIEPQLSYNNTFGRARVSVFVGGTYQKNVVANGYITGSNYLNDALLNSLGGASTITATSSNVVDKYMALIGRATLIWDNRYIVNLTGNVNGSSLFGPDHRFGNFGSVGAGWIFSETQWVKNITPWLSFGKITANYGVTGSNEVQPYQYQPNWRATGSTTVYQGSQTYSPINLLAPDFHWASKNDYNAHLSLGFFHDWLLIDMGGYLNRTADQLMQIQLPSQTGDSGVTANAPFTVQNKGWEISISPGHTGQQGGNPNKFTWFAPSFNISHNYNKITKIDPNSPYANVFRKGYPSSATPFVKYVGVDPATGLFQYLKADGHTLTSTPFPYSTFIADIGDANQMVDFTPAVSFGFNDGFSWKGISVSFNGTFVKQKGFSYLYSVYSAFSGSPGVPSTNMPAIIAGKQWQKPGDAATLQRYSATYSGSAFASSTGVVTDASYLRINNVNITYQLPSQLLRRLSLTGGSINIGCQNALTITPYKVGDPVSQNIYNIPPQRVFSCGVNLTF